MTGPHISANRKDDSYNSILIIIDRLTKIVPSKPVEVTIDALGLAKVIIDVIVRHHRVSELIITDQGLLFTSKFWSLLYYFLRIKKTLCTVFSPQMDGQTERQNSTMEV